MTTGQKIYTVVMTIIFTAFCLRVTAGNADKLVNLKNRLVVSLIFLAPGVLLVVFKKSVTGFFYTRQLTVFKNKESEEKAIQQVLQMGMCLLTTGILIISIGLVLFLFGIRLNPNV